MSFSYCERGITRFPDHLCCSFFTCFLKLLMKYTSRRAQFRLNGLAELTNRKNKKRRRKKSRAAKGERREQRSNKVDPGGGGESGKKQHRPLDTLRDEKQSNALSILYWN